MHRFKRLKYDGGKENGILRTTVSLGVRVKKHVVSEWGKKVLQFHLTPRSDSISFISNFFCYEAGRGYVSSLMDAKTKPHSGGTGKLPTDSSLEANYMDSDYPERSQNHPVFVSKALEVQIPCWQIAPSSLSKDVQVEIMSHKDDHGPADKNGLMKMAEIISASIAVKQCLTWVGAKSSLSSERALTRHWKKGDKVMGCYYTPETNPAFNDGGIHQNLELPIHGRRAFAFMKTVTCTRELQRYAPPMNCHKTTAPNSGNFLLEKARWGAGKRSGRTTFSPKRLYDMTLEYAGNKMGEEGKLVKSTLAISKYMTPYRSKHRACKQSRNHLNPNEYLTITASYATNRDSNHYLHKSNLLNVQRNTNEYHSETRPVQSYICKCSERKVEPCCPCVEKNPGIYGVKGQQPYIISSAVGYKPIATSPEAKFGLNITCENSLSGSDRTRHSIENSSIRPEGKLFGFCGLRCLSCEKRVRMVSIMSPLVNTHRPVQYLYTTFGEEKAPRNLEPKTTLLVATGKRGSRIQQVKQAVCVPTIGQRCPCIKEACLPEQSSSVAWHTKLKTYGPGGCLTAEPGNSKRDISSLQKMKMNQRELLGTFQCHPTKVIPNVSEKQIEIDCIRKCERAEQTDELHDFAGIQYDKVGPTVSHDDVNIPVKMAMYSSIQPNRSKFFSHFSDSTCINERGPHASLMQNHTNQHDGSTRYMRPGYAPSVGTGCDPPNDVISKRPENEHNGTVSVALEKANYIAEIAGSQMAVAVVGRPLLYAVQETKSLRLSTSYEEQALSSGEEYNAYEECMSPVDVAHTSQVHTYENIWVNLSAKDWASTNCKGEASHETVSGRQREDAEDPTISVEPVILARDSGSLTDRIGAMIRGLGSACTLMIGRENGTERMAHTERTSHKEQPSHRSQQAQLYDENIHSVHTEVEGKRMTTQRSIMQKQGVIQFGTGPLNMLKQLSTIEDVFKPTSSEIVVVELEDDHSVDLTAGERNYSKCSEVSELRWCQLRSERTDTKETGADNVGEKSLCDGVSEPSKSYQEREQKTSNFDGEHQRGLLETWQQETSESTIVINNFGTRVEGIILHPSKTLKRQDAALSHEQQSLTMFREEYSPQGEGAKVIKSVLRYTPQARSEESNDATSSFCAIIRNSTHKVNELLRIKEINKRAPDAEDTVVHIGNFPVETENCMMPEGSSKGGLTISDIWSRTEIAKSTFVSVPVLDRGTKVEDMRFSVSEEGVNQRSSVLSGAVDNESSSKEEKNIKSITGFSRKQKSHPGAVVDWTKQELQMRWKPQENRETSQITAQNDYVTRRNSEGARLNGRSEGIPLGMKQPKIYEPSSTSPGEQIKGTTLRGEIASNSTTDHSSLFVEQIFIDHRVTRLHNCASSESDKPESGLMLPTFREKPEEESLNKLKLEAKNLQLPKFHSIELLCAPENPSGHSVNHEANAVTSQKQADYVDFREYPEFHRYDEKLETPMVNFNVKIPGAPVRAVFLRLKADEEGRADRTDMAERPQEEENDFEESSGEYPAARCVHRHIVCPRCGENFPLRPSLAYRAVCGCPYLPCSPHTQHADFQQRNWAQSRKNSVASKTAEDTASVNLMACEPMTKSARSKSESIQQNHLGDVRRCCCSPTPELIIYSPKISVGSQGPSKRHLSSLCDPKAQCHKITGVAGLTTCNRLVYLQPVIVRRRRIGKKCTCKKQRPL